MDLISDLNILKIKKKCLGISKDFKEKIVFID